MEETFQEVRAKLAAGRSSCGDSRFAAATLSNNSRESHACAAESFELLLQNPKQFATQFRSDIAHPTEKHCSFVGQLKAFRLYEQRPRVKAPSHAH